MSGGKREDSMPKRGGGPGTPTAVNELGVELSFTDHCSFGNVLLMQSIGRAWSVRWESRVRKWSSSKWPILKRLHSREAKSPPPFTKCAHNEPYCIATAALS